jgi:hypothetical protein
VACHQVVHSLTRPVPPRPRSALFLFEPLCCTHLALLTHLLTPLEQFFDHNTPPEAPFIKQGWCATFRTCVIIYDHRLS